MSCVPKIGHSSMRHVPPCTSQYTEHQHKFSLTYLSCVTVILFSEHKTCCPRIHLSTVKIHGKMVLLRNSTPPQVMSPKGSSSTGFWSTHKNQIIDDQDDIEEIGVKPCVLQPIIGTFQLTIRQKELRDRPTRTSKTNDCVRCWLHHCLFRNERKMKGQARAYHSERESLIINSSRNPEVSRKPDTEYVQRREANAQRTQAYHSKRESLMTSSSRDLEVSGKPDAVFSSCHRESSQNTFSERDRSNEPGNRFESSVHSVF